MDHTKLLKELFEYTAGFNFSLYEDFLGELCKTYDREQRSLPIEKNEESAIAQKSKIGRYKDNQGKNIDFLIFKLKDGRSIQKARHLQRNVISSYLKDYGVYNGVDHVIAVFYADGYADWRLSFVKQQFKLDPEKKKVINEFTPAKRFSFLVEKGSKNQTIRKQSLELLKASVKPNINEVEKIFSVEKVTKEFFDNYKGLYAKLKEAFENDKIFEFIQQKYNQGDPHFTENFVKKLLGQIVFLYFLQKKGWLGVQKDQKRGDGDKQFLRTLYTQCVSEKKLFFNDYLEPLFYNTLNKERPGHWSDYFGSKIPYLNGGLFQPINDYNWDGVENTLLSSNTANGIFGEILDTFDTFNFTIYENDPLEQDVAVDPEMLGKIFENLLPDNERKGKGAFYTPREIVHYMCKQALIQYLVTETEIPEDRISRLIERKDSMDSLKKLDEFTSDESVKKILRTEALAIDNALKEVKIVDPAVGSGAFPMGILKEIVDIRRYIRWNILQDKMIPQNELLYTLKKQTLSHCIYGVDLDPGAVDIAKLRFWLSLVVDYEGDHIEPLPNLDYKIMQGNSLIENPIIGDQVIDLGLGEDNIKLKKNEKENIMKDGLFERESSVLLKRLTVLHADYFKENSPDHKKKLKKDIHDLENRIIMQKAKETISNLESEIANNYRGDMTEKKSKELSQKHDNITQIKATIDHLTETGVKNYFPWRLHFGEIFRDHGGFDIVIGNPPYVKVQDISKDLISYYKELFKSATGKYDLYVLFIEKGLKFLNKKGGLVFINPHRFLISEYGKGIRDIISETKSLSRVVYFGVEQIFETATTYTGIFFMKENSDKYYIAFPKEKELSDLKFTENLYEKNMNFAISSGNNDSILLKISKFTNLTDYFDGVFQGIVSMGDDIHILKGTIEDEYFIGFSKKLNSDVRIEKDLMKMITKGEDIRRYQYLNTEQYVFYPHITINGKTTTISENDLKIKYPLGYAYILCFKDELIEKKIKYKTNPIYWYGLHRSRDRMLFENPKIITPQLQNHGSFTLDIKGVYADAGGYLAVAKKEYINYMKSFLAIFNSKLFYYFITKTSTPYNNNYFYFKTNYIEPFCFPEVSFIPNEKLSKLVDQIMDQKNTNSKADTSNLEKEIDQIVYELYDLTPEEIVIVEESVKG